MAYEPAAWHDFYLLVGGAAAVLTGLIFVAVSLHLSAVLRDRWHRGRAESSLLALMSVVLISAAVVIPEQPAWALGIEVIVIAGLSPVHSARGYRHLPRSGQRRLAIELSVGLIGSGFAVLAGISLIVRAGGGLWLLLPGAAIALGSSTWNAWRLMTDVAGMEPSG